MVSLITYSGNDPDYLGIVWALAQGARSNGENVELLDLTPIVKGLGDAYGRMALRVSRRSMPDAKFAAIMRQEGFHIGEAVGVAGELPPAAQVGMVESVRSALISYARDPQPNTMRSRVRSLERTLERHYRETFAAVSRVLAARPEIDLVYIWNGRFPHQRAAIEATLAHGRTLRYCEKGERANSYWLNDHSELDRTITQSRVDSVLANYAAAEAVETGLKWMNGRSARGNRTNIYARFFDEAIEVDPGTATRPLVGLFTSSQDEFASLGPEWHLDEWGDQLAGFDHALTHLEQFEFDFYLRVHPNLTTKSHPSFLRERARFEELQAAHPQLRVIWHDEQVSSYALMERTSAVIVWDSTVGLEASGRGIPVWELAASYYDLYADVRQWFSPSDDPTAEEFIYPVDVEKAHRFMGYYYLRYHDLPFEVTAIRECLRPKAGLATSFAALTRAGGAPSAALALSSIVDSVRHRRLGINRMALQRFFVRRSPPKNLGSSHDGRTH